MTTRLDGYVNIGRWYRPEVMPVNGLSGLGDLGDTALDISQEQDALSVANARLGAIGESTWNAIKAMIDASPTLKARAAEAQIPVFWDYASVQNSVVSALSRILITTETVLGFPRVVYPFSE